MRRLAFVKEARLLILVAREQAVRLGAPETGTEHLLLAVAASNTRAGAFLRQRGITPDRVEHYADPLVLDGPLLAQFGIDADQVQHYLENSFGRDAWRRVFGTRHRRFSADATRAITRTHDTAKRRSARAIDAHVVLETVLEEGKQSAAVLRRLGFEPGELASELRRTG